jgi:segregation and condensation protein B
MNMDQPRENTSPSEKNLAALEALLFIYGEPMNFKQITKTLKISENEVREAVKELETQLQQENRGLFIIHSEDNVQLSTKPDFSSILQTVMKEEFKESLTSASLETLSIILYGAPIPRTEIDFIRGVNSSFILRSLLIRGLIDRVADPKRTNAYLYKPSFELLKHLGISEIKDLPSHQNLKELLEKMRKGPENLES